MSFKVFSAFASAGFKTDDETYVVVDVDQHGVAQEVYSTKQSQLQEGHDAQTLCAAFNLAWQDVQAVPGGKGNDAHWALKVRRHAEFDGKDGFDYGDRVYASQGESALENKLNERRMRHALYLLALDPKFMQKYVVKDALNEAAKPQVTTDNVVMETAPQKPRYKRPVVGTSDEPDAEQQQKLRDAARSLNALTARL